jgi:hypothetical protein
VIRRVLALCICVVAFAGCRVDLNVDMTVEPDGTGTITLVATADVSRVVDELAAHRGIRPFHVNLDGLAGDTCDADRCEQGRCWGLEVAALRQDGTCPPA